MSLVAVFTDCRHEVLKVTSGYRITFTYNLLLRGDSSRPEGNEEGTIYDEDEDEDEDEYHEYLGQAAAANASMTFRS